jgi:hypothetical protein
MMDDAAMTDTELSEAIKQRRAAIVHFSHHAEMRPGRVFPDDLIDAITNSRHWALSCHVLWPGHSMDLVGSIGVMLEITSASQVISVNNRDSGSWRLPGGSDQSLGVPLSRQSFEATFNLAGAYNEWRVQGAIVKGIYVVGDCDIYVKRTLIAGEGVHRTKTIGLISIAQSEVKSIFPDLSVYTMGSDGLQRLS